MAYTTIDDPSAYFNSLIYTGNVTVRALTFDGNSDLAVDWIWLKSRSISGNHHLYDSVRGTQKHLRSNLDSAEGTNGGTDGVTAFSSNGVTIGTNTASNDDGVTFVGWGWKAGTSFTNDASSTGVGSIDSTGSVSTDAGFSIISYTGTGSIGTVAHGLGAVPKMILFKNRSRASNWLVYHEAIGNTHNLYLDATNEKGDRADTFNDTSPTSSVFTVGTADLNVSGDSIIAYCFADVQGYSKFGEYTVSSGENNFIYLGFKPAFLMVKQTETGGNLNWGMFDNKRPGFNNANSFVYANSNAAEDTSNAHTIDFVSNGLRLRANTVGVNPGKNYIYMAFAESPFVTSTGVPATAR